MRVFRHYSDLPSEARGAVVAIGNFDGVHRGHQEVINKAHRLARELEAPLAVLTFEPHPRSFFGRDSRPFRLTPFRIKARLLEALEIDLLFVLTFDEVLSALTAEEFAVNVLAQELGVRHVIIGDNFQFGKGRQGNIDFLQEKGREHGFGVSGVKLVTNSQAEIYSSTLVRDYLRSGNPTRAALLLGRYWEIEGRVQSGAQRGRTIGFPTANIDIGETVLPAFGVYAIRAGIDRGAETVWHSGVANFGNRPTVDGTQVVLEVHLFDFDEDLYGQHLRVALVDYIRPEQKFDGLDALKAQIQKDSERARATLALEKWDASWPASPFMQVTAERDSEAPERS